MTRIVGLAFKERYMEITPTLIAHLAKLSRLGLSEAEVMQLTNDLRRMLQYMDQIKQADTNGAEPMLTVVHEATLRLCDDEVVEEQLLDSEVFLKGAPSRLGKMLKVPSIIEGFTS